MTSIMHVAKRYLALFYLFPWLGHWASSNAQLNRPLENERLQCCTLEQYPALFRNRNRKPYGLDGLAIDYLGLLQDELGFQCKSIKVMSKTEVGNDVGFTNFVFMMEACSNGSMPLSAPICKCDLATGSWLHTAGRHGRVDFLPAFVFGENQALSHVDHTFSPITGAFFIYVFEWDLWLAIVGLTLTFACLKLLDIQFAPSIQRFGTSTSIGVVHARHPLSILENIWFSRFWNALKATAMRMVGHTTNGINGDTRTTRQRTLNFAIFLCSVFLLAVYEAALVSNLVHHDGVADFKSLDDINNCHIPVTDICIPKGGAIQSFWRRYVNTRGAETEPNGTDSYQEILHRAVNKTCKYIFVDSLTGFHALSGKHCKDLVRVGKPAFSGGGGSFVLPKHSKYKSILSKTTVKLREKGLLRGLYGFEKRHPVCLHRQGSMGLPRLAVFFFCGYGFCIILLLSFLIGKICSVFLKCLESIRAQIDTYHSESTSIVMGDGELDKL